MTAAPAPIQDLLTTLEQMGQRQRAANAGRIEEIVRTGDTDSAAGALFQSVQYRDPTMPEYGHLLQLLHFSWHGDAPKLSELLPGTVFVKPEILVYSIVQGRTAGLAKDKHSAAINELIGFTPPDTLDDNILLKPDELTQLRRIIVGLRGPEDLSACFENLGKIADPDSNFWEKKIKDANTALIYQMTTHVVARSLMHLFKSDFDILAELMDRKKQVAAAQAAAANAPEKKPTPTPTATASTAGKPVAPASTSAPRTSSPTRNSGAPCLSTQASAQRVAANAPARKPATPPAPPPAEKGFWARAADFFRGR